MFGTLVQTVVRSQAPPVRVPGPPLRLVCRELGMAGGGAQGRAKTASPTPGRLQGTGLFKDPQREQENSSLGILVTVTPACSRPARVAGKVPGEQMARAMRAGEVAFCAPGHVQ